LLTYILFCSDQNYRFRIGPSGSADTSWFAVSNAGLSFGPLPQIFVPRSQDVPFGIPVFIDGKEKLYSCLSAVRSFMYRLNIC
jgi:hypothetical protein